MPHTPRTRSRAPRSLTLRGLATMLGVLSLVLVTGAAIVGAAVTTTAHEGKRRQRGAHDRVALDPALRSFAATVSARRWYAEKIMRDHWLRIGRCEQPGDGYGGVDWSASGRTGHGHFQGGLGISSGLWRDFSTGY